MNDGLVEVQSGVLKTYEGETVEVAGGAYLPPQTYLSTYAELSRFRAKQAESEQTSLLLPALLCGAALVGGALGYWLGRRRPDED